MKYIKPIYKLNDTNTNMLINQYGFRKYFGEIVYRFPVYKYNNKPLIFAEFLYNDEENTIHIRVMDDSGNSYNYNKEEYGKSDVIETVNKRINEIKKETSLQTLQTLES